MSITLIAHTIIQGTGGGSGPFTSAPIDTTGASLIVKAAVWGNTSNPTGGDSKGNTYTQIEALSFGPASNGVMSLVYCEAPTNDSALTFDLGGPGSSILCMCIAAFSGTRTDVAVSDQSSKSSNLASTTIQAGSITPSARALIITVGAVYSGDGTSLSCNLGFSQTNQVSMLNSNYFGSGMFWLDQTSPAAINPTLTLDALPTAMAAITASFLTASTSGKNQGYVFG